MQDIAIPAFQLRNRAGGLLLDTKPFTLEAGRTLAITGPSGAGKTLFLRAMFGWFGNRRTAPLSPSNGAYLMIQDPLQGLTPGLSLAGHFREVGGRQWQARAAPILRQLGLPGDDLWSRNSRSLSGGERQRLMLALILMQQPRVLVCDEPASSLDLENEAKLWSILDDLKERLGLTLVFVSHQLELIREHADGVMLFEQGTNTYLGSDSDFFDNPQDAYHRKLLRAFYAAKGPISKKVDKQEANKSSQPLLTVADFSLRYGKVVLFEKFNWTIQSGSWWWLAGPSGSGKTSLARSLAGIVRQAYCGTLRLKEQKLAVKLVDRNAEQRASLQYLFQHGTYSLNPGRRVSAQLCKAYRRQPGRLQLFLRELGMENMNLNRYPADFSIGENQRFNLIRALSVHPKVLVLDELLSPLDWALKYDLVQFLDRLVQRDHLTVICISHEPRLWRLRPGKVLILDRPTSGNAQPLDSLTEEQATVG